MVLSCSVKGREPVRRITAIIAILIMLTATGSASAQSPLPAPRAANPPTTVSATANDNFIDAWVFYPNIRLAINDIEAATAEIGEPLHSCGAGGPVAGGYSVWFATNLPDGELILKTAGSAYVTAGGTTGDTIITLHRLTGDGSIVDFTKLQEVACGSGDTGAGKIRQVITEGTYLVQVSLESAETVTDGDVALLAKFKPLTQIDSDSITEARELRFPKTYSLALAKNATAALNEPVDIMYPSNTPVRNSVWFRFSLTQTMGLVVQATLFGGYESISIFKVEANGSLTSIPVCFCSGFVPLTQLEPGNYYLRLATPVQQYEIHELVDYSYYYAFIMLATVSLTPTNYELGIDEDTPTAAASLDGWTVKNAGVGDELTCIVDRCGYQITSSGADESTVLMSKVKLSTVNIRKGEMVQMGIFGDYTGEGHVRLTVDLIDAAGSRVRFSRDYYLNGGSMYSLEAVPRNIVPVKARVKIENLSDTPGDSVFIDTVAIIPIRLGTPLPRGAAPQPLPLPPAAG